VRSIITKKYRAEIDGLRAVAILPVVLFHADYDIFSGGYVGVDIFFVISGYLITSILVRQLDAGSFHFADFWERRARRILPAATVVMFVTLVAGWFILLPDDLESLGLSAGFQACFSSNIYFWRDSGYFSPAVETKPLLHTWSLAVEEQFYFIFPVLLFVLSKFLKTWRTWCIAALIVASFALSVVGSFNCPVACFYLLPMRGWELLIGSALVFMPSTQFRVRNELVSILGAVAICYAILSFDQNTRFPGVAALLPCLGTAAIIWSNGSRLTRVGIFLSWRPFVAIGLISYSLYLWHWPLFVYAKYLSLGQLPHIVRLAVIVSSTAVAWLSWKYIETPFRRKIVFAHRSAIGVASVAAILLLLGIGLMFQYGQGFPSRISQDALRYSQVRIPESMLPIATNYEAETHAGITLLKLGNDSTDKEPAFLVWGDSHATAVAPIINRLADELSMSGWLATRNATVPIIGTFRHASPTQTQQDVVRFNDSIIHLVKDRHIKHVLLVARWAVYVCGQEDGRMDTLISDSQLIAKSPEDSRIVFGRQLYQTVRALQREGATVWILKQVPAFNFDVPSRLANVVRYHGDSSSVGILLSKHQQRQSTVDSIIEEIENQNVFVLDPTNIFCTDGHLCRSELAGYALYSDGDHVSNYGAMQMRPVFEPMFQRITRDQLGSQNAKRPQIAELPEESESRR